MDLYQELILEHYKRPVRAGLREPFEAEVHHVNPTCGDEVTLRVHLSDDHETVVDVSYDGQGCSISQASTSVLTDQVIGEAAQQHVVDLLGGGALVAAWGTDFAYWVNALVSWWWWHRQMKKAAASGY